MKFVFVKPPYIPGPLKSYFTEKAIRNRPFNEKIFSDVRTEFGLLEKKASKIQVKTLILWGDQDRIIHPSAGVVYQKLIPNSKLVVLKDCGHLPMLEKPEETAQAMIEFLTRP